MEPGRKRSERNAAAILFVVAAFLFLATAAAALSGLSLVFPAPFLMPLWNLNPNAREVFAEFSRTVGVLLIALGVLTCCAGVGLLRRRRWAWITAVAIFAINGAGDVVTLLVTHDVLRGGSGILIAGAFLFLLTRPTVRRILH
jgi:uncharacterized membrane protein